MSPYDKQRGSSTQRGYSSRWQKARKAFLLKHPLCRLCAQLGRVTAATVVDHIIPHKGDRRLFWDSENNWQSLCGPCHSGVKQAQERSGVLRGCDAQGLPLDPKHGWNR